MINVLLHLIFNMVCLKAVCLNRFYSLCIHVPSVKLCANTMLIIISMPMTRKFICLSSLLKMMLITHWISWNLVWLKYEWMTDNFLKLNDDKSEFIVFGSKCLRDKVNIPHFRIGNSSIVPASKVRNLGAYFDMDMTLNRHISEICKSSSFHLRNIGLIRKYLTNDATEQFVHAFVTSAAPCLWNKLPEYVKTAKSVDSFKTLLKTLIMKSESDFYD